MFCWFNNADLCSELSAAISHMVHGDGSGQRCLNGRGGYRTRSEHWFSLTLEKEMEGAEGRVYSFSVHQLVGRIL